MKQKTNILIRFKHWILSIITPWLLYDENKAKKIKRSFLIYFDGCYGIDPVENTLDTFTMGVCKLQHINNTLTVYLRRPGLLIGKGGSTINALEKYLDCKIKIIEVNLFK